MAKRTTYRQLEKAAAKANTLPGVAMQFTCEQLTALLEWHRVANTRGDALQATQQAREGGLMIRIGTPDEMVWLKWTGAHWQPVR
jgi:hypothetical protein